MNVHLRLCQLVLTGSPLLSSFSDVVLDVGHLKITDKKPLKEKTSEDLDLLKGTSETRISLSFFQSLKQVNYKP